MALAKAAALPMPAIGLMHMPEPMYVIGRPDRQVAAGGLDTATGAYHAKALVEALDTSPQTIRLGGGLTDFLSSGEA
jgi:hypothetical protein